MARVRSSPRLKAHVVERTTAIRLLASPTRQGIMDAIGAMGPLTVAELSKAMQRPPDRLYYHLKLLLAVELVTSTIDVSPSGRQEARFDVAGRPLLVRYDVGSAANRRAVTRMVRSMLRAGARDFHEALLRPGVRVSGDDRNVWAGRIQASLTRREITQVNRYIQRISALLFHAVGSDDPQAELHQFVWVLSPSAYR